jgi:G3E family GTPase
MKLAAAEIERPRMMGELFAKGGGKGVDALLALLLDFEEACLFEHAEVLRDVVGRDPEGFTQLGHGLCAGDELAHESQPGRLTQRTHGAEAVEGFAGGHGMEIQRGGFFCKMRAWRLFICHIWQIKQPMSQRARYIMIGGFLGAGKTTTVGRLARHLSDQGLKVGLITNDQAGGLVDTKLLRGQGYATEEIAGGCFCCRFNTLVDAASKLTTSTKPDVFIAEPVGSCTDLVATVTYPLRRMYGDAFTIAPLSVLVDPVRARRVFGLDDGGTFSSKVAYIFKKQLEEADIIVISKSDLLDDTQREELRAVLTKEFPLAKVVTASPRQQTGLDELFASLMTDEQARRNPMAVDYEVYADGEALLGWLNATVTLKSDDEFEANDFLKNLATNVQGRLQVAGAEIAHFKMTFSPDDGIAGELASINLVRSDYVAELGMELDEPTTGGQLIINLRAEADPASLMEAVKAALDQVKTGFFGLQATLDHEEHFRPGKPTPTHRDA